MILNWLAKHIETSFFNTSICLKPYGFIFKTLTKILDDGILKYFHLETNLEVNYNNNLTDIYSDGIFIFEGTKFRMYSFEREIGGELHLYYNIKTMRYNTGKLYKLLGFIYGYYQELNKTNFWETYGLNGDHYVEHELKDYAYSVNDEIYTSVVKDIDNFLTSKDVYKKFGRSYKRGYLLHGLAGTGKTSLIRYIAQTRKKYIDDVRFVSNNDIKNLHEYMYFYPLAQDGKISIIVFDDFDKLFDQHGELKLSDTTTNINTILRFIDTLRDNHIIFLTCNDITRIPEPMRREGRFDVMVEMKQATKSQITNYVSQIFNKDINLKCDIVITMSQLENIAFKYKNDYVSFINNLLTYSK